LAEKESLLAELRAKQNRLTEIYQTGRTLESEERELKSRLALLEEQQKRFDNYEKIRAGYELLTEQVSELLEKKQLQNIELQKMETAYTCEQAGILAMELEPGNPCPVCGSTEHPEPAKPAGTAVTREQLAACRKEYQEISEKLDAIGKEAASEKGTMDLLLQQMGVPNDSAQVQHLISCRIQEKCELEKRLAAVEKQLDILVKEQEEGMRARGEAELLEQELHKAKSDLEDLQEKTGNIRMEQEAIKRSIQRILLDTSFDSTEDANHALEAAGEELEQKKEFILKAEADYQDWNSRTQSENAVLEQLSGQKLMRMQREQNALEDYEKAIRLAGFDNEAEFEQTMLPAEESQRFEETVLEKDGRIVRFKERYALLEEEFKNDAPDEEADLASEIAQTEEQKSHLSELVSKILGRMETNEKVRKNAHTQLVVRENMQKEYSSVAILSAVANGEVSGKDRLPFEQYVQAFYFEQVIYEANLRLKKMTGGRYALKRRTEAENRRSVTGLDLEIMDYFTGKARSVKSLSGGESFKAALCLALGLSDVIQSHAGGVVVETMFVDEGFGSLDKDSLEQAVAILKELATDNRIVGIISHVEELKECIDKKIVLLKSTQGSSISWKE